jgi:hypothetical protein
MNQINGLLDRPKAYYNIDGVGELSVGVMTLAFALIFWIQVHTARSSAWHQWAWVILFGTIALTDYGSKAIKKHITYPRTGFVEYPKSTRRRLAPIAAAVAVVFAIGLSLAIRSHRDLSTLVSFMGLLLAASYARGFARTVAWKWAVFGVLAVGSLVIAFLPVDVMGTLAKDSWAPGVLSERATGVVWLTFMLYGTVCMVSGAISFWLYLRRTQAPAE